jgi:DNA-binding transcriptional ArsR family regulator
LATASGGGCPGTRFRGIIALSVRVNPTDRQTLRRGPEVVKTIYSFLHSHTIFIYKRRNMKPTPGIGQLQVFKAEFFKALAHPLRIRILEILVNGERSVHELQEILGVDQPTVSQQLAVLRAKNIVDARKEGTVVRYAVRDPALRDLLAVARRIFDRHLIGTQTMLRELRRESRRR